MALGSLTQIPLMKKHGHMHAIKKQVEDSMLEFLKRLKYNEDILLPYNFQ